MSKPKLSPLARKLKKIIELDAGKHKMHELFMFNMKMEIKGGIIHQQAEAEINKLLSEGYTY